MPTIDVSADRPDPDATAALLDALVRGVFEVAPR